MEFTQKQNLKVVSALLFLTVITQALYTLFTQWQVRYPVCVSGG